VKRVDNDKEHERLLALVSAELREAAWTKEVKRLDTTIEKIELDFRGRFEEFQKTHIVNHEKEHEAQQRALALALQTLDKRLEGMNEFRAQINATESKYCTKAELDAHSISNDKELAAMADRLRQDENALLAEGAKAFTRSEHDAYAKGVDTDLRTLRESRAELQGKASQTQMNIAFVMSALSILIGVIALLYKVFRS
jgi:hypothetical protein